MEFDWARKGRVQDLIYDLFKGVCIIIKCCSSLRQM